MEQKIRIKDIIFGVFVIAALIGVGYIIYTGKYSKEGSIMTSIESFIAISIGITTLYGIFWKWYLVPYNKKKSAEKEMYEKMSQYLPQIPSILKEFRQNGSSSLRDGIDRIEVTLSDIKANQKALLEVQELPFWESNINGECIYASRSLCELMGRTEDQVKGNNWAAWLHPKDRHVFDKWNDSVNNQIIFTAEYTYKRSDGFWIDVNGYAVHKVNDRGHYMGSIGRLTKMSEPYK